MNFDAEGKDQALQGNEYKEVYDFGLHWSETFQSSHFDGDSARIIDLVREFGRRLSINLVIGNAAYGLKPKFDSLEKIVRELSGECQIKLGAEGKVYGKRAIDLASGIHATAYILHTPSMDELLDYAKSKKVCSFVYTLCRISGSKPSAISEISSKKEGYFKRRGIALEEISRNIANFAVYGTRDEVAAQISVILDQGASKVVLCPVFYGTRDMLNQMKELGRVVG
ncbi:MAG: hypothetical protein PXY39_14280 [archaeon]|nr:hypothetical protein [archaeon]